MPSASATISADNLDQVVELARWGKGGITDIKYSADGKTVAVGSSLGISIRNADSFDEILNIETGGIYVYSAALSTDGKYVAAGLDDKTAKIWNATDGSLLQTLEGHTDVVYSVAFSPDGTLIATGSEDKTANIWNVSDGSLVKTIKGHNLGVNVVTISPDGEFLFTGSHDGTVRKTQISDGTMVRAFGAHWIQDMKLSADGTILAIYDRTLTYSGYGEIVLWQVDNGKKLLTVKGGQLLGNDVRTIALSPDGKYIAASWRDYTVKIWNVSNGEVKSTLEDLRPEDYYYNFFTVAFSPDSQTVALAGRNVIGTWSVSSGALLKSAKPNSEAVRGIALSPDEKILASTEGTNVYLRQLPDGNPVPSQEEITGTGDVAFSPDGNSLAVGLWEQNAKIWPVTDQGIRQAFETEAKQYAVRGVAFSPDGQLLALGISPWIELRQTSDGSLVRAMNTGDAPYWTLTDLSFSKDGSMIASSIAGTLKVYRVSDGKLLKTYSKSGNSLAFSPDNTLLAGGTDKGVIGIWKVPEASAILTLEDKPADKEEEPAGVSNLVFSPDGTLLFAGYTDGAIRVWKVSDGTLLKNWKAHSDAISDMIITSDGSLLISSSFDGTIRFWGLKP
jgi:WD40 repeat protein